MPSYTWTRFWVPRGTAVSTTASGLLLDPDGPLVNREARRLETLLAEPWRCLVLLGEAGIGKSTELAAAGRQLAGVNAAHTVRVDLGEFSDAQALERRVVESAEVRQWRSAGNGTLNLLLDSLDEALLESQKIWCAVDRTLKRLGTDRVRLLIACRTGVWPESMTGSLESTFGRDQVRVLELLQLRREDVRVAAAAEGLDAEAFLDQIDLRGAGSLAANPISLRLLIKEYGRSRSLPGTMFELYERGLLALCERPKQRADRNAPSPLTAPQLLEVASRVAATMLLARRNTLFIGEPQDAIDTDLLERDVIGGNEDTDTGPVDVTSNGVRLLRGETGLFTSHGAHRLGFAHKTYAEYLAARYLIRRGLRRRQIESLILVPDAPQPVILPQLHEVAAWLASMDDRWFQHLLQHQPELLVGSDVSCRDAATRAAVVDALMQRMGRAELTWREVFNLGYYVRRLNHPSLAEQLRPFIRGRAYHALAREFAIEMAEGSEFRELSDELVGCTLDETDDEQLRGAAAHAVVRLDVSEACQRLRPLALGQAGPDSEDRLRGWALHATWPRHLTAGELMQALQSPKRPNLHGAYAIFLYGDAAEKTAARDMAALLDWAAEKARHTDPLEPLGHFIGRLSTRALDCLAEPGVPQALARVMVARAETGAHEVFETRESLRAGGVEPDVRLLLRDDACRRALITGLVTVLASPENLYPLDIFGRRLVDAGDFAWMLDQALRCDGDLARTWAALASRIFDRNISAHVDLWLNARRDSVAVRDGMGGPDVVTLCSSEATEMRKRYAEMNRVGDRIEAHNRRARERTKRTAMQLDEHIELVLERCFSHDARWFEQLLGLLMVDRESGRPGWRVSKSIYDYPGWQHADAKRRARTVAAARAFLHSAPLAYEPPIENSRPLSDFVPAIAISLLLREDPAAIQGLAATRWAMIAPFLLWEPVEDHQVAADSAALAHRHASVQMRASVREILQRARNEHVINDALTALEAIVDHTLDDEVLQFAQLEQCTPRVFRVLLLWLLRRQAAGAQKFAESVLGPARLIDDDAWPRLARHAAVALLAAAPDAGWSAVWPVIRRHLAFGRVVLSEIAHDFDRRTGELAQRLSEEQLRELLDWLFIHIPARKRVNMTMRAVSPLESLADWRRLLLNHLAGRGTSAACMAIAALRDAHPNLPWLHDVLLGAVRERHTAAWRPPSPQHFLQLVRDSGKRYVASAAQLLDLIIESLDRFAEQLHGDTPSVTNLWNESENKAWRPKDENHLSDNLKRHLDLDLRQRGVVVNREVEIRRRVSVDGQAGQRTDLLVTAITRGDARDLLKVTVEVKGCWHREVRTAMQTQLHDRYLHENQCRHGLYVVGWYTCDTWDGNDHRRCDVPWRTIEESRQQLRADAEAITTRMGGGLIRPYVVDCALR